ncbi:FxsB family cyclophane-forming radical SAM/SPASM peptide maturase [Frankia sp. AgKG'84/4]|uniref:FxsB family cyclophane-forming radical SAM/SPASM peptide maturase n=1 Tax=Frankia sp. AgKG'84/4 TaxID=573490 RepID=UPI00200F4CA5|nr:FxsB family cyclophane-forming radical SAM/SPASM peptide maturase [Frankia sp. AgKG'84/4]MCL9793425.1 FxsB family radical SAM/SPASM domain protein [Frankia sp. AgKG'84/4]
MANESAEVFLLPMPRRQEWPDGAIDVATLLGKGWRPRPFRQFILKVHSRCNLSCTYCYVYHMADNGWRNQPTVMSRETLAAAAGRIAEHSRDHGLPVVRVVLHGGEPLLAGKEYIGHLVGVFRDVMPPGSTAQFSIQTNAVLLDEGFLRTFAELDIRVGVSLDGASAVHDRRRVHANGRGSYDEVARGVRLLASPAYRRLFGGLLCTVDLEADPIETYEELLSFEPPAIDLLLPHGHWSGPPPQRVSRADVTPYADWLIAIFDRWYSASNPPDVRLFQEIVYLLLGGASNTESVGLTPSTLLVIETDGTMEQVDTLKSTYEGASVTGLNVVDHSLDVALQHPSIVARQLGLDALASTCGDCPVVMVCGGGYYPHRYRRGVGFRNPSVYCPDLLRLIQHIQDRLRSDLARLEDRRRT